MTITFDVNKKALQSMGTKPKSINSVAAVFNGRTKSIVEASGGNHQDLIGSFQEPSVDPHVFDGLPEKVKAKYEKASQVSYFSHGLMEAVHESFASHYPLILTPDVIWLTLAQGFANHINANAETLRERFVAHAGKEMIKIDRPNFQKGSSKNDWPGAFAEFSEKIGERIGKKKDLVVSNFSTTTPVERAVSEIVLMDSMKSYFKYAVRTLCGIPRVTLTGTVADWESVYSRVENLAEYDLGWWVQPLLPVLEKLVNTAEGNPDIKFWDEMYKKENGSGGPYIQGWINNLFPYIEDHKNELVKNDTLDPSKRNHGLTMDKFPNSLSKVPFKWELYETITHDMEFLGGIVGVHQDAETLAVEPAIGWAIRDQGTSTPGPIDPNKDW
jgi:Domain of unknown function (DUF4419)